MPPGRYGPVIKDMTGKVKVAHGISELRDSLTLAES